MFPRARKILRSRKILRTQTAKYLVRLNTNDDKSIPPQKVRTFVRVTRTHPSRSIPIGCQVGTGKSGVCDKLIRLHFLPAICRMIGAILVLGGLRERHTETRKKKKEAEGKKQRRLDTTYRLYFPDQTFEEGGAWCTCRLLTGCVHAGARWCSLPRPQLTCFIISPFLSSRQNCPYIPYPSSIFNCRGSFH